MFKLKVFSTLYSLVLLVAATHYPLVAQAQTLAKEQVLRFGLAFNDI